MIAGIDFGSSMTDLVVLDKKDIVYRISCKEPAEAIKIMKRFKLEKVVSTGAYASKYKYKRVDEIKAIGKGGLFVSGAKKALVVSVGSGTAMVSCDKRIKHIGGTPIGGKTLEGLGKLLIGTSDVMQLESMAEKGRINNVDLMIKDIYPKGIGLLSSKASAAHFGKLKDYNKNDIALGLINMAAQSIGTLAVFGAKAFGHKKIVLTGGLTKLNMFRKVIQERINTLSDIPVEIPKNSSVATAIGAAVGYA
ncbi:MAG: pantothenate kinase [Nanoarchaeota archaeon]|nr:pantothenate kinase [Nanoarchaeota archaeon]